MLANITADNSKLAAVVENESEEGASESFERTASPEATEVEDVC